MNDNELTAGGGASAAGSVTDLFPVAPAVLEEDHIRLAEGLIFASADPVPARILQALLPEDVEADAILHAVRERYAGRGVELAEVGLGWQFRTAADLAPRLTRMISRPRRLPRAAMETLAIIAWHQPVTRAQIEAIRGATLSQQTLDSLLEASLVRSAGHREVPGRPTLWATTPAFLAQFGLKDLTDLPRREELMLERAVSEARPDGDEADKATRSGDAVPPEAPAGGDADGGHDAA